MTEEIAATPGWADGRLDGIFAGLPDTPAIRAACAAYEDCLASHKAPAAPSDNLGAEFAPCRTALQEALRAERIGAEALQALNRALSAAEAEIAAGS